VRELSVLIVEDDEDFRALMREALEMEGFRVHAILQKPFDLETLVHVVERYCSRAPVPAQADAASPC